LNGIQRSSFVPCIDLIKSSFQVINLSSPVDYRQDQNLGEGSDDTSSQKYFDFSSRGKVEVLFYELCPDAGSVDLNVLGRKLAILKGVLGHCVLFNFKELFEESKSSADYIEICKSFKQIFIINIPKLNADARNEIRRIITFVDQAYESKVKLYIESEVEIVENLKRVKDELVSLI
jgi:peroxisome-assembly ATPase